MVTSRALETLTSLGLSESECLKMPSLGHEDATSLFLHHAAFGIQFPDHDDKQAIEECVARCHFDNGQGEGGHYLPLVLKALGVQLGCVGKRPWEWVRALPKVRDFNYLGEKENPVFSILRSSFDCLQLIYQRLFMDVVLYDPTRDGEWGCLFGVMEWLSIVYNKDAEDIEVMLQYLQGRGLVEDVDMVSQRVQIHDLYREFAELEARGKLDKSADFEKRRWVYYEGADDLSELEKGPPYRCWANLIRIGIGSLTASNQILRGIEWGYFSNVEVLGLARLRGELNVKGLKCLRSLDVLCFDGLDRVDGLQELNKLAYLSLKLPSGFKMSTCIIEQLPASLRVLELFGPGISFPPDVFTRCTNLTKLRLRECRAKNLDFSACAALQSVYIVRDVEVENVDFSGCSALRTVELEYLKKLQCVAGLRGEAISKLQSLIVHGCPDLVEVSGLGQMVGLQNIHMRHSDRLRKLPDLQKLTRLQVLEISFTHNIEEVPGLSVLRQLRELRWTRSESTSMELPRLRGFEELETADLSWNSGLSSLEDVFGEVPALRRLDLRNCYSLCRLPDLSKSTNLEELTLRGSSVELGEEEMCMLAALPLLHPVIVGSYCRSVRDELRLDVVKRKVQYQWNFFGWDLCQEWRPEKEWDLGLLPLLVKDIRENSREFESTWENWEGQIARDLREIFKKARPV